MQGSIVRTAEQEEYAHPKHNLFYLRDVVTATTNPAVSVHRGRIEPGGEILPTKARLKPFMSSAGMSSALWARNRFLFPAAAV